MRRTFVSIPNAFSAWRAGLFFGAFIAVCGIFFLLRLPGIGALGIENIDAGIYIRLAKEWSQGAWVVSRWLRPGAYLLQGLALRLTGRPLLALKLLSLLFTFLLYSGAGWAIYRVTRNRFYALAALAPLLTNPFLIAYSRSEFPHFIVAFWCMAAFMLLAGLGGKHTYFSGSLRYFIAGVLLGEGSACHEALGPLALSALLLIALRAFLIDDAPCFRRRLLRAFGNGLLFCVGFWSLYGAYIGLVGPANALLCLQDFIAAHHKWIANNTAVWGSTHLWGGLRTADSEIRLFPCGAFSLIRSFFLLSLGLLLWKVLFRWKSPAERQRVFILLCFLLPSLQYLLLIYAQRFWGEGKIIILSRLLIHILPLFYLFVVLAVHDLLAALFDVLQQIPFLSRYWRLSRYTSAALLSSACFFGIGLSSYSPAVFSPAPPAHHWAFQQLEGKVDAENRLIVAPWGAIEYPNILQHFCYFGDNAAYCAPLDPQRPYIELYRRLSTQPVRYAVFYTRPIEKRLWRLGHEFWGVASIEEVRWRYERTQQAYRRFFSKAGACRIAERDGMLIYEFPAPVESLYSQ